MKDSDINVMIVYNNFYKQNILTLRLSQEKSTNFDWADHLWPHKGDDPVN